MWFDVEEIWAISAWISSLCLWVAKKQNVKFSFFSHEKKLYVSKSKNAIPKCDFPGWCGCEHILKCYSWLGYSVIFIQVRVSSGTNAAERGWGCSFITLGILTHTSPKTLDNQNEGVYFTLSKRAGNSKNAKMDWYCLWANLKLGSCKFCSVFIFHWLFEGWPVKLGTGMLHC